MGHDDPDFPHLYFQEVEEYTLRNLTYPSDILNAFAGVLRDHCKSMKTTSFYGLTTSIFDMALLWQPSSDKPRRQGLGLDGIVEFGGSVIRWSLSTVDALLRILC
jgi:hypothetical protein